MVWSGVIGTAGSKLKGAGLTLLLALAAMPAGRADTIEQPLPWQMGMQTAASPVREHIDALHNEILVIITLITLFVLGLLLYVIVRFNAKRNPVPSKTTHAPLIEVIWTVVPMLILVMIAIPVLQAALLHGQGGASGDDRSRSPDISGIGPMSIPIRPV